MLDTEFLHYEVQVKENDDFYTVFSCFTGQQAIEFARDKVALGFETRILLIEFLIDW